MRKLIVSIRLALGVLALAVLAPASGASAQSATPAAREVLARAQAASGGAKAWLAFRGLHETGRLGGAVYRAWYDPLRYGARVETQEAGGVRIRAFNGGAEWETFPNGVSTGSDARIAVAQARTQAFFSVYGFYFPSRFPADITHIGSERAGGRSFEVLRVLPLGGQPRELWFDRSSRLLARIVDRTGATPVIVELSDYRRAGPLMLPFKAVSERGGLKQERVVEKVLLTTPDRALFSYQPPKAR